MSETPTAQERTLESDRKAFDVIRLKYTGDGRSDERALPQAPEAQSQPPPDPSTSEAEPQREQAAPEETPAEATDPTLRRSAEKFLLLKTGTPKSILESMSDEAIMGWAEERRTRESGVDSAYSRAANAERELSDLRAAKATKAKEPKGPTHAEDLSAAEKALVEELSLTDEGRDALGKLIDLKVQPLQVELAEQKQSAKQDNTQRIIKAIEGSRSGLGDRFAQLGDDNNFGALLEEMTAVEAGPRFAGSGKPYADYSDDLMVAAARSLGFAETDLERVASDKQAAKDELHDRVAGAPVTADRQASPAPPSKDSDDRKVYDQIRKATLAKRGSVG